MWPGNREGTFQVEGMASVTLSMTAGVLKKAWYIIILESQSHTHRQAGTYTRTSFIIYESLKCDHKGHYIELQ